MAEVTILKKTPRQAVVQAVGVGDFFCNLTSLLSTVRANSAANGGVLQTFDTANAECTITDIVYSTGGQALIKRNGSNVFIIGGAADGDIGFTEKTGFSLNQNANANILISLSAASTVILGLTKGPGFNEPDLQNLQQYQRP